MALWSVDWSKERPGAVEACLEDRRRGLNVVAMVVGIEWKGLMPNC